MRLSLKRPFLALSILTMGCDPSSPPESASRSEPGSHGGWFTDVAREVGIDFAQENGARGEYQLPEIMGSGCGWIDYDLDGDIDAYFVSAGYDLRGARNRLYRNDGPSGFVEVTDECGAGDAGYGMGCAVGDYDGDGDPDLYVTNFGANRLYRNEGGTFRDVTAEAGVGDPRWSASAVFVDVDDDGHLDLFVTNYLRHPAKSSQPCHDGAGRVEYCGPQSHFGPERDTLYHNQGDGTFRDVTARAGMATVYGNGLGVVAGDFDEDGRIDLFVANDASANQLWVNRGGLEFVDRSVEWGAAYNANGQAEAGMGVHAEDVDGDGHLDIFLTHLVGETNTLYRGDGHGRFRDITHRTGLGAASRGRTGFGAAFFDADHDGDLDLVVANGRIRRGERVEGCEVTAPMDLYAENDQFFEHVDPASSRLSTDREDRGLRFADRSSRAGEAFRSPGVSRGLAVGDYDEDGDLDVLVTTCGGKARLLRNDMPKRGRWVSVRLVDNSRERCVHGARVTVQARCKTVAVRRWTRAVGPAYSYLSSNDPRLHFGLGDVDTADVTVHWPDGEESTRRDVVLDSSVTVTRE